MKDWIAEGSSVCSKGHRYATDLTECPVCAEIAQARQETLEEACRVMCLYCKDNIEVEQPYREGNWVHLNDFGDLTRLCRSSPIRQMMKAAQ